MRKKTYSKTNYNDIATSFIIFLLLLMGIIIVSNAMVAQEKELKIIIVDQVIEADKEFSVTVTDQNSSPVEGADVFIDSANVPGDITQSDGSAFLTAPSEPRDYVLIAKKDGYTDGQLPIKVVSEPGFWESPFFPIVVAIICLVSAIVYVNLRQHKDVYNKTKEISKEKLMKIQETNSKTTSSISNNKKETKFETKPYELKPVRSKTAKDAKVEEIRIIRSRKQKEVIPVEEKKDETENVISEKRLKRRNYDWFEGTDDIRYEIDKLTGEIDEEGSDKWFEGVDDLKDKIDEKVKKKDKKKKEENEE